jgi:hypothetical protein
MADLRSFARQDGEALQRAKREAAKRFYEIGMNSLPAGWTFAFRKSLTGLCWTDKKHIDAPRPVTRKSLYIWLHECAHAHLHGPRNRKPSHVKEYEAEVWAHGVMRAHGIPVPRKMTEHARRNVLHKIDQANASGAKSIDPAAQKYALGPSGMKFAAKMRSHMRKRRRVQ